MSKKRHEMLTFRPQGQVHPDRVKGHGKVRPVYVFIAMTIIWLFILSGADTDYFSTVIVLAPRGGGLQFPTEWWGELFSLSFRP